MYSRNFIAVKGARVHNLKNVSVKIPRDKITVITGISGSGKSSLAFDTVFAEGQRRYVESLSSFARQFLGVIEKPDVDEITGLSPALAIDQRSIGRSSRSTVGTLSEIYDFLRLIWASVGTIFCDVCGTKMLPLAFSTTKAKNQSVHHWYCPKCGNRSQEVTISSFSFNSPIGACQICHGLGKLLKVDTSLVVPNQALSLAEGAVRPWTRINAGSSFVLKKLAELSKIHHFSLLKPYKDLPESAKKIILHGAAANNFEGVVQNLERRYRESDSDYVRGEIEKYMISETCPDCRGVRLNPKSRAITVAGRPITEITALNIAQVRDWLGKLTARDSKLKVTQKEIIKNAADETRRRLKFLVDVGLGYLSLDRGADTLAGGEAQRIRLATQLGSRLLGVIYILDEPTIGLHARDEQMLLSTVTELKNQGNTVIMVEHDKAAIESAEFIIDVGPGAGENGGYIVAQGTLQQIKKSPKSLTVQYLSGKKKIYMPRKNKDSFGSIIVEGARHFNLKNITVAFPARKLVCVTGVSGSGKSTLVSDILSAALRKHFYNSRVEPGLHKKITGIDLINKIIEVDQSAIGRTPRSNPATYTGVFGPIREIFASTELAKKRRYNSSQFSFNLKGGRCENCHGDGMLRVEMHFLPSVYVKCELCNGRRYNTDTLEVLYNGKSIDEVLAMSVDEAAKFFIGDEEIIKIISVLQKVGLGYLKLGQPATTLSGGEAQRIKLAAELARPETNKTLYIFDEPTTGLHFEDISRLLHVLHSLVDRGNTVIVVEHNMDIIKNSDWVIDLGPEAGEKGGYLVAQGKPAEIAKVSSSYTGQFLKKFLD